MPFTIQLPWPVESWMLMNLTSGSVLVIGLTRTRSGLINPLITDCKCFAKWVCNSSQQTPLESCFNWPNNLNRVQAIQDQIAFEWLLFNLKNIGVWENSQEAQWKAKSIVVVNCWGYWSHLINLNSNLSKDISFNSHQLIQSQWSNHDRNSIERLATRSENDQPTKKTSLKSKPSSSTCTMLLCSHHISNRKHVIN